jgi:TetR/AcrR family transcriptional regulator, transcriptional repressor of aconitase
VTVPKVSEAHLEARREQILAGARRAFGRYGYHGATVARLEQETGLSRGAIFNYYPDKWSLFLALVRADRHRFFEVLAANGFEGLLRQLTQENPDWLSVYFELAHLFRTNPKLLKDFEELAPEESRDTKELFAAWQRDERVRGDVDLRVVIQFFGAIANGLAIARSLGDAIDIEAFMKLVHTGLDPQPQ